MTCKVELLDYMVTLPYRLKKKVFLKLTYYLQLNELQAILYMVSLPEWLKISILEINFPVKSH
jgi:hypothetical protein